MNFVKPKRIIKRVFIHCSASDSSKHDHISIIRGWHLERGFSDIGYHFFIQASGNIQPGRNIEASPAAQEGNNANTIAICLHGLTKFTTWQFGSLKELCEQIRDAIPGVTFLGHCEVNPNKTCPVFDYRKVLGLDKSGKMK